MVRKVPNIFLGTFLDCVDLVLFDFDTIDHEVLFKGMESKWYQTNVLQLIKL